MDAIERFEGMLRGGADSPLLRYALGLEHAKRGRPDEAIVHLGEAVRADPGYSAAWKAYGGALAAAGRSGEAAQAYRRGIEAAEANGDRQAAKEMGVFLRRVEKESMNEDEFNLELRKFLKKVGITSQREIEKAVRARLESGKLEGAETMQARVTLEVPDLDLRIEIGGEIGLER